MACLGGLYAQVLPSTSRYKEATLRAPLQVDDDAVFEANENMLERLLAVDDVDAVYTNCAGLQ